MIINRRLMIINTMIPSKQISRTRYVFNPVDSNKKNPSKVFTMDSLENWVSGFVKTGWRSSETSTPIAESYKELDRNFTSKITHAGFIHYLHLCWAKEIGCELRPDMLYYTIISELASEILEHPDQYVDLFTGTQEKQTLVTVGIDGIIKADSLVETMRGVIKSPEFLSAVCDVTFDSDVVNASYARKMAFACMGTPFYDYLCTMCGIPHIEIIGCKKDWNKLLSVTENLASVIKNNCPQNINKYFDKVIKTIKDIIHYSFRKESSTNDAKEFFSKIFDYGKNSKCGSGHPDNIVHGWAKSFYINGSRTESSLGDFSSHVNYVPFTRDFDHKSLCQVVTLAFSELDEKAHVLRPDYGIITYEVVDDKTYNKIANPEREDENGIKYQPLSLKQLKEIVDGGTIFNPAGDHYNNPNGNVICDRCRYNRVDVCMGYGKNNDLCIPCVNWVKQEWNRLYGPKDK
jgi:hypothetical protein